MKSADKHPCVLLVDDNTAVRESINLLVTSLGWVAVEARHAKEALEQLLKHRYDLAIIDIRMPETNGIELCHLICAHPTHSIPKIIILSGYVDQAYRQAALTAGAKLILEKPVGRDALREAFKAQGLPYES